MALAGFEGASAIVTGGAGGLGEATVRRIRVNTIAPGTMRTPIMESVGDNGEVLRLDSAQRSAPR